MIPLSANNEHIASGHLSGLFLTGSVCMWGGSASFSRSREVSGITDPRHHAPRGIQYGQPSIRPPTGLSVVQVACDAKSWSRHRKYVTKLSLRKNPDIQHGCAEGELRSRRDSALSTSSGVKFASGTLIGALN